MALDVYMYELTETYTDERPRKLMSLPERNLPRLHVGEILNGEVIGQ